MRTLRSFAVIGAAAFGLVACESEREILNAPHGGVAYGTLLTITNTNVPRGNVRFPKPTQVPGPTSLTQDTVRLTLRGVDSLPVGAAYNVWLSDSLGVKTTRATGSLRVVVTDTIVNAAGDPQQRVTINNIAGTTQSFSNGGPGHTIDFFTTRERSGLTATDSIQHLIVTIETNAAPTAPNPTRMIIWSRRTQGTDTAPPAAPAVPFAVRRFRGAPLRFGSFKVSTDSNYILPLASGSGRVYIRNDVLVVNDSGLPRPPLGYYYAVYAVKTGGKDTVYLGPEGAPYPRRNVSLRDADSLLIDAAVQQNVLVSTFISLAGSWPNASPAAILAASVRASADTIPKFQSATKPFAGWALIYVTLESKEATPGRMGPVIFFTGNVPDVVVNPPTP